MNEAISVEEILIISYKELYDPIFHFTIRSFGEVLGKDTATHISEHGMAFHYFVNHEVILTSLGVDLVQRTILNETVQTLERQFLSEDLVLESARKMGAGHMTPPFTSLALNYLHLLVLVIFFFFFIRAACSRRWLASVVLTTGSIFLFCFLKQCVLLADHAVMFKVLLHAALVAKCEVLSEGILVVFDNA